MGVVDGAGEIAGGGLGKGLGGFAGAANGLGGEDLVFAQGELAGGLAIGARDELVNEVFVLHREKCGPKRKDGARPIRALSSIGLMALRDLRVRALG